MEDSGDGRGPRPPHLPGLDGLRGIAVAAVIAYHLGHLRGGFIGVDLFFVLSGFLITRLLIAERGNTGRISLRGFWARRIRRLVPAMLMAATGTVIAARAIMPSWRMQDVRADALSALAYVANWRFVLSEQSYFTSGTGPSPLRHTWSLAVEEQFYVLWPLLGLVAVAVFRGRARRGYAALSVAVAVGSAGWMAFASSIGWDTDRLYYGTDTRIFAMAIGGFVAVWFDPLHERIGVRAGGRRIRSGDLLLLGGLAAILAVCLIADEQATWIYRGGLGAVALLSAATIVGASIGGPVGGTLLGRGPLRWLGIRSYGLYLYSWPVQVLVAEGLADAPVAARDAVTIGSSLVIAAASYRWVEAPILAGAMPLSRRPRRAAGARSRRSPTLRHAALALAGAVAVTTIWWVGDGPEVPDFMAVDDHEAVERALGQQGFAGETVDTSPRTSAPPEPSVASARLEVLDPGPNPPFDPALTEPVTGGDRDPTSIHGRRLRVLILGDSVAWSIGYELEEAIDGVELSTRAIIGCGMLPIDQRWLLDGEAHAYGQLCVEQTEAEDLGFASGPDVIVIWAGAWEVFDQQMLDGSVLAVGDPEYADLVRESIQQRTDRARQIGVGVILVQAPCFGPSRDGRFDGERRDPDRVAWFNEQVRAVAARNPGWVRLLDPSGPLCDGDGASTLDDGTNLRPDGAHFTRDTARMFWDLWLRGAIASAMPAPEGV